MLAIGSGECMGGTSIPRLHHQITTAQTLAPNDITSARWQHPDPGIFWLSFLYSGRKRRRVVHSFYSLWSQLMKKRIQGRPHPSCLYLQLVQPSISPHLDTGGINPKLTNKLSTVGLLSILTPFLSIYPLCLSPSIPPLSLSLSVCPSSISSS